MFSDDEYKQLIQANPHQPTVAEDQRFGVHFEYQDLCQRLARLSHRETKLPVLTHVSRASFTKIQLSGREETRAKSTFRPKASVKVLPRSLSPLQKSGSHQRIHRPPLVPKPLLRILSKKA